MSEGTWGCAPLCRASWSVHPSGRGRGRCTHGVGAMLLRPSVWARGNLPLQGWHTVPAAPEAPGLGVGSLHQLGEELEHPLLLQARGRKPRAALFPQTSLPFVRPIALFHAVYMGGK